MRHQRPALGDMEGGELRSNVEQVRALVEALRALDPSATPR
jgi:copper homeostasis protein